MSRKDYYKILEIDKSATKQEIRAAYFKLARIYHPKGNSSLNPKEQKANTQKFQEISDAYSILYDDEKRAAYDRGIDPSSGNFSDFDFSEMHSSRSSSFDFSDFFDLFSGRKSSSKRTTHQRTSSPKEDLRITLDEYFTLEDIYNNKEIHITYRRNKCCEKCSGEGISYKCSTCNGQGVKQSLSGIFISVTTCYACNGQGYQACKSCFGKGAQISNQELVIKIPGYVINEKPIKIPKMGGYGQGDHGDLYISLRIKKHIFFTHHENNNLEITVPIISTQAIAGGIIPIPTIEHKCIELRIPSNTQTNIEFTLSGYGMPKLNGGKANLIVKIYVETPQLTEKEIAEKINLWELENIKYSKVNQFNKQVAEYIKK